MESNKIYGIESIDGYINETLKEDIPRVLMWPLGNEDHHTPRHINANIYGISAGSITYNLYGLLQFFENGQREKHSFIGLRMYDTEFLEYINKPLMINAIENWIPKSYDIWKSESTVIINHFPDLENIPYLRGHRIAFLRRYIIKGIEVNIPNKITFPQYLPLLAENTNELQVQVGRNYNSLVSSLQDILQNILYTDKDTPYGLVYGFGLLTYDDLRFIEREATLPKPNIIIARDLAMDPVYNLDLNFIKTKVKRQSAVEERLREKFEQYRTWSNGRRVVFIFDVHDFMEDGHLDRWHGGIKFDFGMSRTTHHRWVA